MKAVIGNLRKESYLWRANSGKDQTKCISKVRNQFPSPMRFAEAAVCSVIPAFYAQWLTLETNTIRRSWALTQRRWQGYTTKKRMFMSISRTKSPLVFPETGFIPVGGWNLPLPNLPLVSVFNVRRWHHRMTNTIHLTLKMTSAQVVETSVINLTLKMTSAQVVETSVTNNSSFQNYLHPDDHTIRTTQRVSSIEVKTSIEKV